MNSAQRIVARFLARSKTETFQIEIKPFKSLSKEETIQLKALSRGPGESMYSDLNWGQRPTTKVPLVAILAKEEDNILGWWSLQKLSKGVVGVNAFTSSSHRGKGIGTTLGREAIRYAKTTFKALKLVAIPRDAAGSGLYGSLGFKPSDEEKGTWVLDLKPQAKEAYELAYPTTEDKYDRPLVGRTAAIVTLDQPWVEKLRKDFLTLMKNVPRLKDYDDAVLLSQAITTYANRFKELFFDHFLNMSLKYEEKSLSDQDKNYIDKKLRKSGWDFYIELSLPFSRVDDNYSQEARFLKFRDEAKRWENRVKDKARTFWTDMHETIDWYERIRFKMTDDPEKIHVKTPDVDQVTIEGFQTRLRGYDTEPSYKPHALEQVKWALKDYRQKAKQRLPLLLQKQLPLVIDFEGGLDDGGRYEQTHIWINATSAVSSKDTATRLTKTLAHEMGHHIFQKFIAPEAAILWNALIRGDYGDIDLKELLLKWPESITWADDFSNSIRESDPILSLQVATVSEGYQPGGMMGRGIDKRQDFQAMLDKGETSLRVPKTPITGYAGKNSEEAFCETVGLLVAYGPRAVHEKIRSWLDVVLPGQVKLANFEINYDFRPTGEVTVEG